MFFIRYDLLFKTACVHHVNLHTVDFIIHHNDIKFLVQFLSFLAISADMFFIVNTFVLGPSLFNQNTTVFVLSFFPTLSDLIR